MSYPGFSVICMTAYAAVPNLYQAYNVSPQDSCQSIGILLAGKDAQAESAGLKTEDPERHRLGIAYSVLSSPDKRRRYDQTLTAGTTPTWNQLEYLGNFGDWPPAEYSSYEAKQQQRQRHAAAYASPYAQPFNPFQVQGNMAPGAQAPGGAAQVPVPYQNQQLSAMDEMAQRPSAGTRIAMCLLDWFLAAMVGGAAAAAVDGVVPDAVGGLLPVSALSVVMVLYYIVCESVAGATPGKMMFGYEVRDRETKKKLTAGASLKRNWFRAITLVPFIGWPIGFIGGVVSLMTISPKNQLTGSHDDLANAEVAKRRGR